MKKLADDHDKPHGGLGSLTPINRLLHPGTVAKWLGKSRKSVYALVHLGELEAIQTSPRGLRIVENSVRSFIERHRVRPEEL